MPPLPDENYLRPWEELVADYGARAQGFWDAAMTGTDPKGYKLIDRVCRRLLTGDWLIHRDAYRICGDDQLSVELAIHMNLHPLEHVAWFEPDDYGGVGGVRTSAIRLADGQLRLL